MKRIAIFMTGMVLAIGILFGFWKAGRLPCGQAACSHSGQDAAAKHSQHEGHDHGGGGTECDEHEEPEASGLVHLDEKVLREHGVVTAAAGPGALSLAVDLPGEIALNADRVAHLVPRTPGIVREVYKNVGDFVKAGEILAVIDSRELADLKAAYLAAMERLALAEAAFVREESLWEKKISAQQEYLDAKRSLAETKIECRTAEQKLHTLGFSESYLKELPAQPHASFTRYEITAPIEGTILEKHIVLGEVLQADRDCFTLADLSSVWVNLHVSPKDLPSIQAGQTVLISTGAALESDGVISLVLPVMSEETRTALARVVIPNPQGLWRAGQYVTGRVTVDAQPAEILVPQEALTRLDGSPAVFVKTGDGFQLRRVTTGRSDRTHTEILTGLAAGEIYAARGAFLLKSELQKPTGDEHGHGH